MGRVWKIILLAVVSLAVVLYGLYIAFACSVVRRSYCVSPEPEMLQVRSAQDTVGAKDLQDSMRTGSVPCEEEKLRLSRAHRRSIESEFRAIGFAYAGGLQIQTCGGGVSGLTNDFVDSTGTILGSYYLIQASALENAVVIDFGTEFEDGGSISTNNMRMASIYHGKTMHRAYRFPWIRSVRELYDLHRRILATGAKGRKVRLNHGDSLASDYRRIMVAQNLAQVEKGMLKLDPVENVYKLTPKGAFISVVHVLPPTATLILALQERQARALHRRLMTR